MSVIVNQLTKVYGTQIAVNHISFTAEPGKIVGFLGPNGAGKSTTMKMITGFIPPSDGTATVCGFDINTHSMDVRKCLGYLPENNPLYLDMYVKEFLAFVAGLQQLNNVESRIKEMIEQTGLEREQYKKISQLSKGYRQRVGLAQAMLHDPKVLILDEPTTGLDPQGIIDVRNLILRLKNERNKTIMLSSHQLSEIEIIANRMVIINQGKTIVEGGVQELLDKQSLNVEITVDRPEVFEALMADKYPLLPVHRLYHSTYYITLETEERNQLTEVMVASGCGVRSIVPKRSLEDFFIKIISS